MRGFVFRYTYAKLRKTGNTLECPKGKKKLSKFWYLKKKIIQRAYANTSCRRVCSQTRFLMYYDMSHQTDYTNSRCVTPSLQI